MIFWGVFSSSRLLAFSLSRFPVFSYSHFLFCICLSCIWCGFLIYFLPYDTSFTPHWLSCPLLFGCIILLFPHDIIKSSTSAGWQKDIMKSGGMAVPLYISGSHRMDILDLMGHAVIFVCAQSWGWEEGTRGGFLTFVLVLFLFFSFRFFSFLFFFKIHRVCVLTQVFSVF